MDDHSLYLPPGFRFHPTDEEIITHYLMKKITDRNFCSAAIAQANFNDCEPWDLPRKAKMGDKEWYFFCQKDRKYPTGMRINRATKAGYWKTTGKDKEIFKGKRVLIGKKKTLVFYKGRAPNGERTNWVMHEYRIEGQRQGCYSFSESPQDEWVVCKVYHKTKDSKISPTQESSSNINSFVDDMLVENPILAPLLNSPCFNSSGQRVEDQPKLENEINKSIFSQSHLLGPWSLHQAEEKWRAPFIFNQGSVASSVLRKVEQPSNSITSTERNGEATSAIYKHQLFSLLYSSDMQAVNFDSILNYEMV